MPDPEFPFSNLVKQFVPGVHLPPGRTVWETPTGWEAPSHWIVLLDAELYLGRASALESLREYGAAPAVFVSHVDAVVRTRDFTCRKEYAAFLVEEFLPWVRARHPAAAFIPVVLVGLSLSGLAAAHAMLTHPGIFTAVICQSPSFWWEDERFAATLPERPAVPGRFWVSVGTGETEYGVSHAPTGLRQNVSQIDACRRAAQALQERGHEVAFRTFEGGHDPICWGKELAGALRWAAGSR